jgi:hypothetical protein
VQYRQHLGKAHRGLPAFQFNKEAKAHPRCRSQLILTQALREARLTDDGSDLFDGHVIFPIGNTMPDLAIDVDGISRTGMSLDLCLTSALDFTDRESTILPVGKEMRE